MTEGPYRISDRELDLDIEGYALLVTEPMSQPSWLQMPGTGDLFCAVFSTKEKAEEFAAEFGVYYDKVKQVNDAPDFIESIEGHARIIIDPHSHNGKVRFTEIFTDSRKIPQPI